MKLLLEILFRCVLMTSNLFEHGVSLFLMVLQWKEFNHSLELCKV